MDIPQQKSGVRPPLGYGVTKALCKGTRRPLGFEVAVHPHNYELGLRRCKAKKAVPGASTASATLPPRRRP